MLSESESLSNAFNVLFAAAKRRRDSPSGVAVPILIFPMRILTSRRIIAILALSFAIAVIWQAVRSIQYAGQAEKTLHAVIATANALEDFVASQGRWPTSWDDLEGNSKPIPGSMYELPRDVDIVRRRVSVRFDLPLDQLSHPQNEGLVEPIGPCFEYDRRLTRLYAQIERSTQKESSEP